MKLHNHNITKCTDYTDMRVHTHTYTVTDTHGWPSQCQSHWFQHKITVGGMELSWFPIRTSARCKGKTPRSNSYHEGAREIYTEKERQIEAMNKHCSVSAVIQPLELKEQILLFLAHLKFRVSGWRKQFYNERNKIRKWASLLVLALSTFHFWVKFYSKIFWSPKYFKVVMLLSFLYVDMLLLPATWWQ